MISIEISGKAGRQSVRDTGRTAIGLTNYIVDLLDPEKINQATSAALVDYALNVDQLTATKAEQQFGFQPGEKVAAFGVRNLLGSSTKDWQAQMAATASIGARAQKSKIVHWAISLREGEELNQQQAGQLVDLFAEEMGCKSAQMVWAAHANTSNFHIHLVINRVDPATGKIIMVGGKKWKFAAERFNAKACKTFGLQPEPNARFEYDLEDGTIRSRHTGELLRHAHGTWPTIEEREAERRTLVPPGKKQVETPETDDLRRRIAAAKTWDDLQSSLSEVGAHYRAKGSGAVVRLQDGTILKASKIARDCSRAAMERRLGPIPADTVPIDLDEGHTAYVHALDSQKRKLEEARDNALSALGERRAILNMQLSDMPEANRATVAIAMEIQLAQAEAAIKGAFSGPLGLLRGASLSVSEYRARGRPSAPDITVPTFAMAIGAERQWSPPSDLIAGQEAGRTIWRKAGQPVVIDHDFVLIAFDGSDKSLEAMLWLASARWTEIQVTSDAASAARLDQIAKRLGIHINALIVDGKDRGPAGAPRPTRTVPINKPFSLPMKEHDHGTDRPSKAPPRAIPRSIIRHYQSRLAEFARDGPARRGTRMHDVSGRAVDEHKRRTEVLLSDASGHFVPKHVGDGALLRRQGEKPGSAQGDVNLRSHAAPVVPAKDQAMTASPEQLSATMDRAVSMQKAGQQQRNSPSLERDAQNSRSKDVRPSSPPDRAPSDRAADTREPTVEPQSGMSPADLQRIHNMRNQNKR